MGDSIIKSGRKRGFTVLYKSAIEDQRLPLDARGLLAVMVGLPEDWSYTITGLAEHVGVGRNTIRRLLGILEEVGYLVRDQAHDESGRFAGNVYILQDEAPPSSANTDDGETPLSANTDDGENRQRETPLSAKRTQLNTHSITKDPINQTAAIPREIADRVAAYCGEDAELRETIMGLLKNRIKINRKKAVVTDEAMKLILGKLDKLSGGRRELKLAMLRKAIEHNWLTVYELASDELPPAETAPGADMPLGWGV